VAPRGSLSGLLCARHLTLPFFALDNMSSPVEESLLLRQGLLLVQAAPKVSWLSAALVLPLTLIAWYTISWASSPLRKYPGPFLAGMACSAFLHPCRQHADSALN
jgi:hypothetical protein